MLFKILVLFFISIYSVSITTETVFARTNRKKKSNRKSSSKRNKRKNRSQSSAKNNEKVQNLNNEAQENKPVNNLVNNSQTSQNTVTTNEPIKQETESETQQDEIKSNPNDKPVSDVSKDKKWEEFRLCMQQGCSGGDDQPTNVECYKTVTFDKQFNDCKPLIEESKRKDFKKYFLNTFIPNEKKEFCENKDGPLQGVYENDTCKIKVKFKRNYHKNECLSSCNKVERIKTISINKSFTCSPEWFGVEPCYKDSNGCSEAKVKKITGGIAIAGGVVAGVVSGVASGFAGKNKKETTDEDKKATDTTNEKKKESGYDHGSAALDGISAGLDGVTKGAGELATAVLLEKEKGEALKGNCILPDGSAIGEGKSKKITW